MSAARSDVVYLLDVDNTLLEGNERSWYRFSIQSAILWLREDLLDR